MNKVNNIKNNFLKMILAVFLTVSFAQAQTVQGAIETVKSNTESVLSDLNRNLSLYKSSPKALNKMIDRKIVPAFDIDVMAKYVLGKNWKHATKTQRKEFISSFKTMIMRTYAKGMFDYTNANITYNKVSAIKKNRTKIKVTIINNNGKKYILELRMRYNRGKWKAYDVSMDGLSIIASYRSSVGQEVAEKGIDAVTNEIKGLNKRGAVEF